MVIALTPTQRQFARYAAFGLVSNLTLYFIYILLTTASLQPRTAMTIMYAFGVLVTFLFNRNWTFAHPGPRRAALIRYILIYAFGYAINFFALYVMVDYLGFPHQVVQAGLILFLAIALFSAQKWWVFCERHNE